MAEKKDKKKRTVKFLIEDGWYIIPDVYSWNLAKQLKNPTKTKEFDNHTMTYHATVEQALAFYLQYRRSEASRNASDGTIENILNIITAENKRTLEAVCETVKRAIDNSGFEN